MLVDPEKLLLKLSKGSALTEREISAVIASLSELSRKLNMEAGAADEAYALLHLLTKITFAEISCAEINFALRGHPERLAKISEANTAMSVVEAFLEAEDPLIVALALEVLCVSWGLLEDYRSLLEKLSQGNSTEVDEDLSEDARRILEQAAGSESKKIGKNSK